MKTLGKLKINSEKLLKNEELVNLKGGYGGLHYVVCSGGSGSCQGAVFDCAPSTVRSFCNSNCSGWSSAACA